MSWHDRSSRVAGLRFHVLVAAIAIGIGAAGARAQEGRGERGAQQPTKGNGGCNNKTLVSLP